MIGSLFISRIDYIQNNFINFLRIISTLPQHFHVTGLKVVIKYSIKILLNVHMVMFKLNYNTEKGAPTTGYICLVSCKSHLLAKLPYPISIYLNKC